MASFADITSYGDGAYKVIIVAALLVVLQVLMVAGRFASRKMRKAPLAADDFVLLVAAALTIGLCALALAFPRIAGIGAPDAITQTQDLSESKILGQSFTAWSILYGLCIVFSKCAILLLYVRVFTTSNKAFIASVYLIGFVVVATGIANTFVAIFQCSPIAFEWNKSIQGGVCIDQVVFERYMTIPNVVTGVIMLIMPLPLTWRLNLSVSARVALTATLLHGIIGIVASCARLSIFFRTDASTYSNNTSLVWTIWTINEPANYIIAASLPTLRPLFLCLLPTSFFVLSNAPQTTTTSKRRPTRTTEFLQSPSSSTMLSPLETGAAAAAAGAAAAGANGGRQHFRWTRTVEHGTRGEECWVDVETGRESTTGSVAGSSYQGHDGASYMQTSRESAGGIVGGGGYRHDNGSSITHHRNDNDDDNEDDDNYDERRLAVMRTPGHARSRDGVVLETMVQVRAAGNNGYF